MQVKCFDCGVDDWMKKFHHENTRCFCNEYYKKRIQPERSKREDQKICKKCGWPLYYFYETNDYECASGCGALNTMET